MIVSELNQRPINGAVVTLHNGKDGSTQQVITGEDGKYEFQTKKRGRILCNSSKRTLCNKYREFGQSETNSKRDQKTVEQNLGLVGQGGLFLD